MSWIALVSVEASKAVVRNIRDGLRKLDGEPCSCSAGVVSTSATGALVPLTCDMDQGTTCVVILKIKSADCDDMYDTLEYTLTFGNPSVVATCPLKPGMQNTIHMCHGNEVTPIADIAMPAPPPITCAASLPRVSSSVSGADIDVYCNGQGPSHDVPVHIMYTPKCGGPGAQTNDIPISYYQPQATFSIPLASGSDYILHIAYNGQVFYIGEFNMPSPSPIACKVDRVDPKADESSGMIIGADVDVSCDAPVDVHIAFIPLDGTAGYMTAPQLSNAHFSAALPPGTYNVYLGYNGKDVLVQQYTL